MTAGEPARGVVGEENEGSASESRAGGARGVCGNDPVTGVTPGLLGPYLGVSSQLLFLLRSDCPGVPVSQQCAPEAAKIGPLGELNARLRASMH